MSPFKGTIDVHPFRVAVPDNELGDLKQLLRLSKIGPETFENTKGDASFGLSRSWVIKAREHWLNAYDWYDIKSYAILP
jgi:microsomal epoxide hydrolase